MKQSRLKQSVIRSGVVALGLLVLAVLALEVDLSFLESRNAPTCYLQRAWCAFLAAVSGCSLHDPRRRRMVLRLVLALGVIARQMPFSL